MPGRIRLLNGVVMMALMTALTAGGTDIDHPSLEEIVSASDRIARVEILGYEAATFLHEGAEQHCGTVYTAHVVEPLKGGGNTFKFLAATERDFVGTKRDYLVFALKTAGLPRPGSDDPDAPWVRCRLESAPFLLSERAQVMIPFGKDGAVAPNGEWLRIARSSAISTLPMEEAEIGGQPYGFVKWPVAKNAIMTAIAKEPRVISRVPRCH